MKLLFANRYFFPDESATSQMLSDLAFDLAGDGHQVHVVTSRQLYGDAGAVLAAEQTIDGVHVHRVAASRFGRGLLAGRAVDYLTFQASATLMLLRLARRGDVIVAMTDPPLMGVGAAMAARLRGAMLVNWLQDLFPEVAQRLGVALAGAPLGPVAKALRDRSLRVARANVVLGERMEREVRALTENSAPTHVIENWADGQAIQPMARESNPLRAAWGLEGKFVVTYSGNMGRAHEFDTILDACEALRGDDGIAFLFVGAGQQRERIERESARRGLRIVMKPYQPRAALSASLGVADAHLVSLRPELEGLIVPSKAYGIAAAGRPAIFIGARDGELARALQRDASGLVVTPGDSQGLAQAILQLRDDPQRAREMGLRARRAFEARNERAVGHSHWNRLLENIYVVTKR